MNILDTHVTLTIQITPFQPTYLNSTYIYIYIYIYLKYSVPLPGLYSIQNKKRIIWKKLKASLNFLAHIQNENERLGKNKKLNTWFHFKNFKGVFGFPCCSFVQGVPKNMRYIDFFTLYICALINKLGLG